MQQLQLLAASTFSIALLYGQAPAGPSIEINHPGPNPDSYVHLPLSDFPRHVFRVSDAGVASELAGTRLDRLLAPAGWASIPEDQRSGYIVQIDGDGDEAVSLPLSEIARRSLDNRTLLVTERNGRPLSRADTPWLVVVGASDIVTLKIRRVRRIRVSGVEPETVQDPDFSRLSSYAMDRGARMLWERYARVNGMPILVVTWTVEGRREKGAVLLIERVLGWTDRQLLDFLAGPAGLGVERSATVARGTEFAVVGFDLKR